MRKDTVCRIVIVLFAIPVLATMFLIQYGMVKKGFLEFHDFLFWIISGMEFIAILLLLLFTFINKIYKALTGFERKSFSNTEKFLFTQIIGSILVTFFLMFTLVFLKELLRWSEDMFLVENNFNNAFSAVLAYYSLLMLVTIFYPDEKRGGGTKDEN